MSPDDRIRLRHMAEAAEQAQAFARGRQRADLDTDTMLRFALTQAVQIVGEAAANVSPEGRAEAAAIEWPAIVGMRNRLVHAYFDIDANQVWTVVVRDLPVLLGQLQPFVGGGGAPGGTDTEPQED